MNITEVRNVIKQAIAEAMDKGGLPKSGGKLVHLKKELASLKNMRESLGQLQIAEGGDQSFVAEYAHMQKFVNELEKIKTAHAKLAEMLDKQISDVEGKVSSETEKIKEMVGLIEKAPKKAAKKDDKKSPAKKDDKKAEPKKAEKKEEPKADDSKKKAKKLDEASFSSTDVNAILKAARAAVEAGKEVTVDGIKIGKVVPGLGRFIPADGSQSLRIMDYVGEPEKIVIDGVPAELKPYEPKSEPRVDTRTPEEKAKAQAAFDDRYGPGGGYDTAFGRYTGD
jgi:flagellar biosynthesis chaperone FliJ